MHLRQQKRPALLQLPPLALLPAAELKLPMQAAPALAAEPPPAPSRASVLRAGTALLVVGQQAESEASLGETATSISVPLPSRERRQATPLEWMQQRQCQSPAWARHRRRPWDRVCGAALAALPQRRPAQPRLCRAVAARARARQLPLPTTTP